MPIRPLPTLALLTACGSSGGFGQVAGPPGLRAVVDVWAFSKTDVWFLDSSATVQRYDGKSWSTLATPSTGGLQCIFALSATQVWLCAGEDVLFYDGMTFTSLGASTLGSHGLVDLWASSKDDVWVVGDQSFAAHYDGMSWRSAQTGLSFMASIWGAGPSNVYALDVFDLAHFDGTAWTKVDGHLGESEGHVWGTSANDVWVTGSHNLHHFDGMSWTDVPTEGFVGDISVIWGPAPDDLYGAGSAGAIAHYDGKAWQELTHQAIGAPFLRQLVAIHGTSSTDVWTVGTQLGEGGSTGVIFHH